MNVMIFDTETISIDKPFCYNIGYVIMRTEDGAILKTADYIVEQVWHNKMLFSTAYYADKRPLYILAMRRREAKLNKYGHICQAMATDIKNYEVKYAFAFNSSFDERVFDFNCDWFKCNNPLETVPVYDIRGYAHHYICDNVYKKWCEENEKFSESGNYSSTAESVYQFLIQSTDFEEAHTALADSKIESTILYVCLLNGAKIDGDYKPYRSLTRNIKKSFQVKLNKEIIFEKEVCGIRYMKNDNTIILKE